MTSNSGATGNTRCGSQCPLRHLSYEPKDPDALVPIHLDDDDDAFSRTDGIEDTGADSAAALVFSPLRPWQTRLIVLQPGVGNAALECDLIAVDLIDGRGCGVAGTAQVVTYEAVSYSWGRSKPNCLVAINGHLWGVSEELANALVYLRSRTEKRYLWCDALCINQSDLVEKAGQIRSMLRIFEKADRVLAWLGKPMAYSGRLCKAFQLLSGDMQPLQDKLHDEVCLDVLESLRSSLRQHLSSQWFLRTWIRQEVFAAKELMLHLGPHAIPFELFTDRVESLHRLCFPQVGLSRQISIPPTFSTLKHEYQHMGTDRPSYRNPRDPATFVIHCLRILRSGSLFQVTDEKDRIYGMLGILTSQAARFVARLPNSPDALAAAFPVDYAKPLSVVFENVVKFLINETRRLGILDVFRHSHNSSGFASWAIDWRNFRPGSSSVFVLFDNNKFNDGTSPSADLPLQDYSDHGKLRLVGVRALGKLSFINGLKELNHPRERFSRKSTPLYFSDFVKTDTTSQPASTATQQVVPQREARGLRLRIIAARIEEDSTSHLLHLVTRRLWNEGPSIKDLASDYYAFAYTDERSFYRLHKFHYLVPRHATLNDVIVSFYGSMWFHLIRRVGANNVGSDEDDDDNKQYIYLGPVAAVMSEDELASEFGFDGSSQESRHTLEINKASPEASKFRRTTFTLV